MMSDVVIISLVTAATSIATTVITAMSARRITKLEHNTNAITEHLVKTTAENAFAKGVKAGEAK